MDTNDKDKKKSLFYYLFKKQIFVLDDLFKNSDLFKGENIRKLFLCLVTSLIVTFLITQEFKITTYDYKKGDIAKSNIKATINFKVEDPRLTEEKRQEANNRTLSVYDYDSKIPLEIKKNVDIAFGLINHVYIEYQKKVDDTVNSYILPPPPPEGIEEIKKSPSEKEATPETAVIAPEPEKTKKVSEEETIPAPIEMVTIKVEDREISVPKDKRKQIEKEIKAIIKPEEHILTMKSNFEEAIKITVSDEDYKLLLKEKFSPSVKEGIKMIVSKAMSNFIVRDKGLLSGDKGKGVIIRWIETQEEEYKKEIGFIRDYKDMESIVADVSKDILAGFESKKLVNLILQVSKSLITPSLTFNKNETETRKTKNVEAISPVFFEVKKGEIILREGDPVEEHHILKLRALISTKKEYRYLHIFLGIFMMLTVLMITTYAFASKNISKFTVEFKDLLLICSIAILGILVAKSFTFISEAISAKIAGTSVSSYYYAIPFALGAMTIRIVLNSETALVYSLFSSFLFALLIDNSIIIFIYW
jgi:membrane-associated HD superfamily phosphohydrolase